ncbi:MAG: biotin--[acetyl-CoA-carboxylase] ligase [Bacilli bacterium]|nr:biotin--[acetyl-CoA-carboxylase] ligase [Bacilli bacterium]
MKRLHFDEINSTNTYIKKEYSNLDNLTFVSTNFQSQGRGRLSRQWHGNKGENIMFSYLIKDNSLISNYSYISMFNAALVVKYLESLGLNNVSIKWPNDVYVNDKKVVGILLEGKIPSYIVVGIGLNLNQTNFDNSVLRHPASSVKLEKPDFNSTSEVETKSLINLICSFWIAFRGEWNVFDDFIKKHNYLLNKRVKVDLINENIEGTVVDIDVECNLLIKTDKEIVKINSGEIQIL